MAGICPGHRFSAAAPGTEAANPRAGILTMNRKFFFVAGMLRSGFCRKMRHFSHKTPIFPRADIPATNRKFFHHGGMLRHGFCAPIRVFQASNTARVRTEPGRPAEAHRPLHKTRIFPRADIPATNRKFFLVAGMLRHGFCRTTRRFSRKTRIFPGANTPAINKNFLFMAGMPHHGFCAPIRVFQASNTARVRTESGRPAETRRFSRKTRIFPGANTPAINKNFLFMAGMFRHGFCRTTRRFSRKTRIFPGANTPAITEKFSVMAGMLRHGFSTAVRPFRILNGSANPGGMPGTQKPPGGAGETAAVRWMAERYGGDCRKGSGSGVWGRAERSPRPPPGTATPDGGRIRRAVAQPVALSGRQAVTASGSGA